MWIILLDHSGSMGQPFRENKRPSELRGRIRISDAFTKFDAAKESLLERLEEPSTVESLAIMGFTSTTSLVFKGKTDQIHKAQTAIKNLRPNNGTDIAQALFDAKSLVIDSIMSNDAIARVLVISDGLSDISEAEQAAKDLSNLSGITVIIDVIIIDPTDEDDAVARAIAIRGTVQPVTSRAQLKQATDEVVNDWQRPSVAKKEAEISDMLEMDAAPSEMKARRVIGFPLISFLVIIFLMVGIAYFLFSNRGDDHDDTFLAYFAMRQKAGVLISWQIRPNVNPVLFRVETKSTSGQVILVKSIDTEKKQLQYRVVDDTQEALSRKRVMYRLVYRDIEGKESLTHWFKVKSTGKQKK